MGAGASTGEQRCQHEHRRVEAEDQRRWSATRLLTVAVEATGSPDGRWGTRAGVTILASTTPCRNVE